MFDFLCLILIILKSVYSLCTHTEYHYDKDVHRAKRFKPTNYSGGECPINLSQPAPQTVEKHTIAENDRAIERNDFCFSQPTLMEDLILCTQMNSTQSTQNPFHRLVKRMTRFVVTISSNDTIKRITDTIDQLGYAWKTAENSITVSTIDRRKIQLIFKINLIEMNQQILVDFRLSNGDGIEFKRRFIQIKRLLNDIIGKDQSFWKTN